MKTNVCKHSFTGDRTLTAMLRNAAMGLLGHLPVAQHIIATKLAELDSR